MMSLSNMNLWMILFVSIAFGNSQEYIDLKLNQPTKFCCPDPQKNDVATFLWYNGIGRVSSALAGNIKRNISAKFEKKHGDWKALANGKKLCISKSKVNENDNFKLVCKQFDGEGFGSLIDESEYTFIVTSDPQIKSFNLTKSTDGTLEGFCKGTGEPFVTVTIKDPANNVLASASSKKGEKEIIARIDRGRIPLKGSFEMKKFSCEVDVSRVQGGESIANTKQYQLVRTMPQIKVIQPSGVITTKVGALEEIDLEVKGNPKPRVECPIGKIVEAGKNLYKLQVKFEKKEDVKPQQCTATNSMRSVPVTINFSLKPSMPEIYSKNQSEFVDYYQLRWSTVSKTPLKNVTIKITDKGKKFDQRDAEKKQVTMLKVIEFGFPPAEKDKKDLSFVTQDDKIDFANHITKLPADTSLTAAITICNEDDCETKEHQFSTPSEENASRVTRSILDNPPVIITQSSASGNPNNAAPGSRLSLGNSVVLAMLVKILLL